MACRGNRAKIFGSGQKLTGSDPQKKSDMYFEPQGEKNGSGSESSKKLDPDPNLHENPEYGS